MQLDTAMEFPTTMKDTMPTNGQHNANGECFMMRELLMSLNKNLAHRLNFQKITTQNEKEHWTFLHQKYENLRLEKLDNNWLHRMGVKLSQSYQNVVRQLHKWNAKGTLTHPIRDEYRKALEGMGRVMGKLRRSVRRQKRTNGQKMRRQKRTNGQKMRRQKRTNSQKTLKELFDEERREWGEDCEENQCHEQKTLKDLFAEKNFEAPEVAIEKIDKKIQKILDQIEQNSLRKRLNIYQIKENRGLMNWHFLLRPDEADQKMSKKDKENVELIKKQLQIFDKIINKMGKQMPKASSTKPTEDTGKQAQNNDSEHNGKDDKSIGMGFELRFMGYTEENDGQELLKTLQDEMKLNLDQFNMSFDGQCDPTTDLSDCFVASDGLDVDGQIEKLSLFGKKKGELGALERAAESLFKKLNRWSYKFGQRKKGSKNFLKRFFFDKIHAILEVIPKMMTDQMSPFEVVIPFYLPMKNLTKYTFKKVVVGPGERLRALFIKLIATANLSINGGKKHKLEQKEGDDDIERVEMSKIEPSINVPNDQLLSRNEVVDGKNGDNKAVNKHKRGRRGIMTGAGINAYIVAGKEGSSTAAALLIDAKVVDWSLTAPLPGLQLHWLHINHSIMLGKFNIATSLTTGILVIFIMVSMLYWWHALKLSVYLAILYGDNAGWVCLFVATVFYIMLCVGFVIG
uniref:Uncharacterized protein n=1 Tax=Globodera rostochiensis TaxID=31243 RepID=A0A914IEH3_GLORO